VSDTYCSSAESTKLGADLPTSLPGTPVHRLRRMATSARAQRSRNSSQRHLCRR
jgi:hypothetical protein